MCTLSWSRGSRFRTLLFNRDESRSRQTEEPPEIRETPGFPRFLAPRDPDAGGTWIAVNEFGLGAAVLNWYSKKAYNRSAHSSRGLLPVEAMRCRTAESACARLEGSLEPERYNPFRLVLFDDRDPVRSIQWDGDHLESTVLTDQDRPISTSSVDSERIEKGRRDLFRAMTGKVPRLDELLGFHSHHDPENPALGPAMVRPDATTRSLIVARIDETDVSLRYQTFDPRHGCFLEPTRVSLPRRIAE